MFTSAESTYKIVWMRKHLQYIVFFWFVATFGFVGFLFFTKPQDTLSPAMNVQPVKPVSVDLPHVELPPLEIQKGEGLYAPVLMYHRVAPKLGQSPYYVSPDIFDEQMAWLRDNGYTVISYDTFFQGFLGKIKLPARPVVLTFDDADDDHYTNAFPILKKYGYTGTFFVPVNFVGTKGHATWKNLQEMVMAGMDIESHSMTHPSLDGLSFGQLDFELGQSKKILEKNLGISVKYFAYPGGSYSKPTLEAMTRAGYLSAATTKHHVYHPEKSSPFLISRMHIDSDMISFVGFVTGKRKN